MGASPRPLSLPFGCQPKICAGHAVGPTIGPGSARKRKRGRRTCPPARAKVVVAVAAAVVEVLDAANVVLPDTLPVHVLKLESVPSASTARAWDTILGRPDLATFHESGVPVYTLSKVRSSRGSNYASTLAREEEVL